MYVNVDMENGKILNTWVDSLSASFAAVQVQLTLTQCSGNNEGSLR
jgi:hypothetical protein